MSTKTPSAKTPTIGATIGVTGSLSPVWRSVAIGAVASAVSLPLYLHGLVPLDEGLAVHVADRLSQGEVLYRDVATGVGPGLYYMLAAFYVVAPPTLELARVFQVLLLGVQTALVHRIALRVAAPSFALLAAGLFSGVNLFGYRYASYSPVAVLFQLGGVLLLLRFARSGSRATLVWSGALLGLCALTKQNYGLFALVGAAASVVLLRLGREAAVDRRPFRARLGKLFRETTYDGLALASGAAVPGCTTLVLLGLAGALPLLWQYSVVGVLEGTTAAFTKPYPLLDLRAPFFFVDDAANFAPFPPTTELLSYRTWRPFLVPAVAAAYLVPLAVILVQAVRLIRGHLRGRASAAHSVLVPGAALMLLGVLPRADYHHLTLVIALLWVLLADLAARLPPIARSVSVVALALFAVGSAAAPYAQVLVRSSEQLDTPLELTRAPWLRAKENEARGLRAAVGWLEDTTRPDEPVLVVTRDPLVYFLADRANASPFPLTLPGAFDHGVFAAALERVATVMARDTGHDELPLYRLMPELYELLRQGFEVDQRYLDRLQLEGGPPPEMQPLYALRRREVPLQSPMPEEDLALLEALLASPHTILNPDHGAFLASSREEPRLIRAQWLLEPALLLRPPSGWQKLAVAIRARPRPGDELRFSTALRPPQRRDREDGADGAFLEVLLWDEDTREVEQLHLETLEARERGVWRWRDVAVPLDGWAGREVVLVLAASPGPSLREVGDEVLVTPPRLHREETTGRGTTRRQHARLAARGGLGAHTPPPGARCARALRRPGAVRGSARALPRPGARGTRAHPPRPRPRAVARERSGRRKRRGRSRLRARARRCRGSPRGGRARSRDRRRRSRPAAVRRGAGALTRAPARARDVRALRARPRRPRARAHSRRASSSQRPQLRHAARGGARAARERRRRRRRHQSDPGGRNAGRHELGARPPQPVVRRRGGAPR
jgi:hypothetical protein